ncbi:hypothetical protein AKJ09_09075 [Labilithrix luteola]|uniref:Uncharacterized protein n=1 Tax=Labilithrix luteola TaxID=1391654 RepID=A0A0K1Q9S1_9BACT|nr:hypothetical protein [Labilithrix luteola]AKV02412.1 hypothetical protein AKJ09_09075 [Labilithrix luteola]
MAEEKKPKIDLKARLGKAGGNTAAVPVPTPAPDAIPAPVAAPSASAVGGAASPAPRTGVPVPPGTPVGPPPAFGNAAPSGTALDPSNPLAAAVAGPYRAPAPAAPPQPQRIEVDEASLQQARKGALKQGVMGGLVAAVVLGVIGYIAGGASETSKGRQRAVTDAKSLSADVTKSREQLKELADKVEAGRNSLLKDRKYPDALVKELGGINIDFDGTKLAGVRFSGFSQDTTSGLIEFITSVQSVNDRKSAVSSLLTKLQKPITEQLSAGQKQNINHVVLLGGPKDPAGNVYAVLAPLTKPIEVPNPQQVTLPAEFTATNPLTKSNVSAPKYASGNLDKPAAIYVVPKSVEAACPSETSGQIAQLGTQLTRLINDIRGEASGADDPQAKAGLLERADKLVTGLNKVQ